MHRGGEMFDLKMSQCTRAYDLRFQCAELILFDLLIAKDYS